MILKPRRPRRADGSEVTTAVGGARRRAVGGGGSTLSPVLMLGVILGLGAAVAQAVSYLFSRRYSLEQRDSHGGESGAREGGGVGGGVGGAAVGAVRLLAVSHAMQGVVCLVTLPWLWPSDLDAAAWPRVAAWCVGVGGFYIAGQGLLVLALLWTDASRVSPLLGLKVVAVAGVSVVFLGVSLTAWQWAAVGLASASAVALNFTGGRVPSRAVAAVALCCLGYVMSDVSIRQAVTTLEAGGAFAGSGELSRVWSGLFLLAVTYVGLGVAAGVVLPLLPGRGSGGGGRWLAAMPYAAAWLVSMALFFACLAAVGIVLANILQSTRGIISVALGAALASHGLVHLETRAGPGVVTRRLLAAAMMTAAVGLYLWGGRA